MFFELCPELLIFTEASLLQSAVHCSWCGNWHHIATSAVFAEHSASNKQLPYRLQYQYQCTGRVVMVP